MKKTTTRTEVTEAEGVRIGDTWSVDSPVWHFEGTVTRILVVETIMEGEGISAGTRIDFRSVNCTVVSPRGDETVVDAAANGIGRFSRAA